VYVNMMLSESAEGYNILYNFYIFTPFEMFAYGALNSSFIPLMNPYNVRKFIYIFIEVNNLIQNFDDDRDMV
jgi:hypothetical protein